MSRSTRQDMIEASIWPLIPRPRDSCRKGQKSPPAARGCPRACSRNGSAESTFSPPASWTANRRSRGSPEIRTDVARAPAAVRRGRLGSRSNGSPRSADRLAAGLPAVLRHQRRSPRECHGTLAGRPRQRALERYAYVRTERLLSRLYVAVKSNADLSWENRS
jgi:hypothetical protein